MWRNGRKEGGTIVVVIGVADVVRGTVVVIIVSDLMNARRGGKRNL